MTDFFKHGNKVYSENLNDGILVGNAFDWTVSIGLPADNEGVFPNSSTIVKAKVADVYATPNSNLSIGSTIENSSGSSQVYRLTVYPNFNRFGGFKSISLTADSGVTLYIANKGGTSPIASNLDYDDLSNVPQLKVLKEYDIVLTIPNGKSVSGLEFVFQSSSADVSGSIAQSNVTGLSTSLDGKASSTHVHGSISNDGKVGTNANYFVYTTTGGAVTSKQKIGNITTDGKIGSASGKIITTGTNGLIQASDSITTSEISDFLDKVYPVGSIYMSVNSTSPSTLFGGTWEQVKDTFLLACGDTYQSDGADVSTAQHGSANSIVVSHNHEPSNTDFNFLATNTNVNINGTKRAYPETGDSMYEVYATSAGGINEYETTSTAGSSGTGKNMPPYIAVYMWKRTA